MCLPSDIEGMASRIEALGLDRDFAEHCACWIGDTPVTFEGSILVMDDDGSFLAVLPERKLYDGIAWRWEGVPDVVVVRGKVNANADHIALCSDDLVLARLAPNDPSQPEAELFLMQWLVPRNHEQAQSWTDDIFHSLSIMFTSFHWLLSCRIPQHSLPLRRGPQLHGTATTWRNWDESVVLTGRFRLAPVP